ncbi:MAG: Ldh family oxidoreductase [Bacillota bacterium]
MPRLSLEEIKRVAQNALVASKTSAGNAEIVAASLVAAEADGIATHGLLRLPTYCSHARSGKVDGFAHPVLKRSAPSVARVDARNGFAHPAIRAAIDELAELARAQGVAVAAIYNSYNSGVMGHHVEELARRGLVALAFANAPATIAPWGGNKPLFGTNPIAFAAPREDGEPVVIDQASSVVARGEILLRAQRGEKMADTWAFDSRGKPTADPKAALDGGSLAPAGGHKGVNMAFIVEVLAATLTGALHSFDAGSLTADDGKPAGVGQLFIALATDRLGGKDFQRRLETLCEAMLAQEGTRLPGARRYAARAKAHAEGVDIDAAVFEKVRSLA